MGTNTAVGALTSIGLRYLLTASVSTFTLQHGVFHTLDMTISNIAAILLVGQVEDDPYVLGDKDRPILKALLTGRAIGFIAAASFTSLLMGPVNLPLLILVSSVSQVAGFVAWDSLPKQSHVFLF